MDKKEFEQTIKITELFYRADASDVEPEQLDALAKTINEIADYYIELRKSNQDDDSWQRYNALGNLFSDAIKVNPDLAFKQDENGNTFMHKMANAGFWSVCLSAIEDAPNSIYVKNDDGQTYVDVYGAAELKGSCAKVLRLCGGADEYMKGIYKILDEVYPDAKDPYAVALEEYLAKQKNEKKEVE